MAVLVSAEQEYDHDRVGEWEVSEGKEVQIQIDGNELDPVHTLFKYSHLLSNCW